MKNQQIALEYAVKNVDPALISGFLYFLTSEKIAEKKLLFDLLNFQHNSVEFRKKYYTICRVSEIVENSVEKVKKPFKQRIFFVKNSI